MFWALYSVWSWLGVRRHGVVFVVRFVVRSLYSVRCDGVWSFFFVLEIQVHSAQMLSESGGPAHYTLVTKPMQSGVPEVDAMRRGLDAMER